jgi:hypothetical protein
MPLIVVNTIPRVDRLENTLSAVSVRFPDRRSRVDSRAHRARIQQDEIGLTPGLTEPGYSGAKSGWLPDSQSPATGKRHNVTAIGLSPGGSLDQSAHQHSINSP